jgi:hypothetical protein
MNNQHPPLGTDGEFVCDIAPRRYMIDHNEHAPKKKSSPQKPGFHRRKPKHVPIKNNVNETLAQWEHQITEFLYMSFIYLFIFFFLIATILDDSTRGCNSAPGETCSVSVQNDAP